MRGGRGEGEGCCAQWGVFLSWVSDFVNTKLHFLLLFFFWLHGKLAKLSLAKHTGFSLFHLKMCSPLKFSHILRVILRVASLAEHTSAVKTNRR